MSLGSVHDLLAGWSSQQVEQVRDSGWTKANRDCSGGFLSLSIDP